MSEKGITFHQTDITSARTPLDVQAMVVKDPQIGGLIGKLHGMNLTVSRQRLHRTPDSVREIVQEADSPIQVIAQALSPQPSDTIPTVVHDTAQNALVFSVASNIPLTKEQQATLSELNAHPIVQAKREGIVRRRFKNDRPRTERKKLSFTGGSMLVAGAAATALEVAGIKGAGLFAAQSVDDIGNTVSIPITEKGGKKNWKQIAKESLPVLPVLGAAAVADYTFIPQLLESPSTALRMVGGALFGFAAVGGSIGANVLHIRRTMREKTFKESVKHHLSHNFRKFVWIGAILSEGVASYASAKGIMIDKPYSGALQTLDGQLETITAYGGLLLTNSLSSVWERAQDWLTVKRAKEPIQIFPAK